MLKERTVAVVVPAYNEESQIGKVIESMPEFVDLILIVNDKSKDNTSDVVQNYIKNDTKALNPQLSIEKWTHSDNPYDMATNVYYEIRQKEDEKFLPNKVISSPRSRVILIDHLENGGVGAAIASGYKLARDYNIDCTAVMAGDGQMDPSELESICMPVIEQKVDYCKGNRLSHQAAKAFIPKTRYIGNSVLSILTKIASGYWRISDTQTGYTSISLRALEKVNLWDIYKSYGMPNDLLVKLNIESLKITEIPIKPVYNVGEQSKMKVILVVPRVSLLLLKSFFKRLWTKYFKRSFHPLFLLYFLSFILFLLSIPFGIMVFKNALIKGPIINSNILVIYIFFLIMSFQSFFFAMWMDMQDNERLYIS